MQGGVNAEYCRDDITAGKCFNEDIVPFVIGTTASGCVFGFLLLILSLCLFCKTRVKNGEIDWVHDREPSDWVRDVGMINTGLHMEPRKQGLGDDKPQYYVSDRSLYSERATSAFPSSNASDIMSAMDDINDDESKAPSGYYWAYGGASGGATPSRGTRVGDKLAAGVPGGHTHGGRTLSGDMLNGDTRATHVPRGDTLDGAPLKREMLDDDKFSASVPRGDILGAGPLRGEMLNDDKFSASVPRGDIFGAAKLEAGVSGDDILVAGVSKSDDVPIDDRVHGGYFHDNVVLPEKDSDYATIVSSKTVDSAQILNRRKHGSKMNKAAFDGSSTTN